MFNVLEYYLKYLLDWLVYFVLGFLDSEMNFN